MRPRHLLLGGGVLSVIGAIVILLLVPKLVHEGIENSVPLTKPRGAEYLSFKDAFAQGITPRRKLYLWDTLNSEKIEGAAAIPEVKRKGPYVYAEHQVRNESEIAWLPNGTMQYKTYATYEFLRGESCGPETDKVLVPDYGLQVFLKVIHFIEEGKKEAEQNIIDELATLFLEHASKRHLFSWRTVKELVEGYHDPLLTKLSKLLQPHSPPPLVAIIPSSNAETYARLAKDEIYTGGKGSAAQPPTGLHNHGRLTMWQGMRELPYWGSKEANTMDAFEASMAPPFLSHVSTHSLFVEPLMRKFKLEKRGTQTLNGVKGDMWKIAADQLQKQSDNKANAGYYMTYDGFFPAPPSDVSHPLVFSQPMFHQASKVVGKAIYKGVPAHIPSSALEPLMVFEPMTGVLLTAHFRIQANFFFKPIKWVIRDKNAWQCRMFGVCNETTQACIPHTCNLTQNMMPFFYLEREMTLPKHQLEELKKAVFLPLTASRVGGGIALALGIVSIGSFFVLTYRHRKKRQEETDDEYQFHALA